MAGKKNKIEIIQQPDGHYAAHLKTTFEALEIYRRRMGLAGYTFCAQVVAELAEFRREFWIEQRVDIQGKPTRSVLSMDAKSDALFEITQDFLDRLAVLETFRHRVRSEKNIRELREVLTQYEIQMQSMEGDFDRNRLLAFRKKESFFSAGDWMEAWRKGESAFDRLLRDEALAWLSSLKKAHMESLKEGFHWAGHALEAIQNAMLVAEYSPFALSQKASFKRSLIRKKIDPRSDEVSIDLNGYVRHEGVKGLEHLMRFTAYLNQGAQKNEQPPLTRKNFFLQWIRRFWIRRSGVNHPDNDPTKLGFLKFLVLRGFASLLDNISGFFLGFLGQEMAFFRQKVRAWRFSNKPKEEEAQREWKLRLSWKPSPTFLNRISLFALSLAVQLGSTMLYGMASIWERLRSYVESIAQGFSSPVEWAGQSQEKKKLTDFLSSLEPQNRLKAGTELVQYDSPSDIYKYDDLLGFGAEAGAFALLGLTQFIQNHPVVSMMLVTSGMLTALPTVFKTGAQAVLDAVDGLDIGEKVSLLLPAGKVQVWSHSFCNNYLASRLNLASVASLAHFDAARFSHQIFTYRAAVNAQSVLTTSQSMASLMLEGEDRRSSSPASSHSQGSLEIKGMLEEMPLSLNDEVTLGFVAHFDQLASLPRTKKNEIIRWVSGYYQNQLKLRDILVSELQRPTPLQISGIRLLESPFSVSLLLLIRTVFLCLEGLYLIPRWAMEKITKKHSLMIESFEARFKLNAMEVYVRTAASLGNLLFQSMKFLQACVKLPLRFFNRCFLLLRVLKPVLFGLKKEPTQITRERAVSGDETGESEAFLSEAKGERPSLRLCQMAHAVHEKFGVRSMQSTLFGEKRLKRFALAFQLQASASENGRYERRGDLSPIPESRLQ